MSAFFSVPLGENNRPNRSFLQTQLSSDRLVWRFLFCRHQKDVCSPLFAVFSLGDPPQIWNTSRVAKQKQKNGRFLYTLWWLFYGIFETIPGTLVRSKLKQTETLRLFWTPVPLRALGRHVGKYNPLETRSSCGNVFDVSNIHYRRLIKIIRIKASRVFKPEKKKIRDRRYGPKVFFFLCCRYKINLQWSKSNRSLVNCKYITAWIPSCNYHNNHYSVA